MSQLPYDELRKQYGPEIDRQLERTHAALLRELARKPSTVQEVTVHVAELDPFVEEEVIRRLKDKGWTAVHTTHGMMGGRYITATPRKE